MLRNSLGKIIKNIKTPPHLVNKNYFGTEVKDTIIKRPPNTSFKKRGYIEEERYIKNKEASKQTNKEASKQTNKEVSKQANNKPVNNSIANQTSENKRP